ncbi:hypothetical protein UlMin_030740 [Ulmus minor]
MNLSSQNLHLELQSEIEKITKHFNLLSWSATNLSRVLSLSLNGSQLSFSDIQTTVAPHLFQGLWIIPHITQISYIGLEGLFFSYYTEKNETFVLYSNSSMDSYLKAKKEYTWYKQQVNPNTGKPYGNVITSPPLIRFNDSWIKAALNSSNGLYSSLGSKWNTHDLLFLNTVRVNRIKGLLSLGFLVESMTEYYTETNFRGGSLFLATRDGKVLVEKGLKNTEIVVSGNLSSVLIKFRKPNGDLGHVGSVSCEPNKNNGSSSKASVLNIRGTNYLLYCSPLDIVGIQSVNVLAFPQRNRLNSFFHKYDKLALILLILIIVLTVISIFSFLFILFRATKREMQLCSALIKQMEATEQAERKSMNKSLAFASASHDIRAALAGISGLIEICNEEAALLPELCINNLRQMDACTKDLLGILNSILDTSKIEAGKMQLEEEDFDVAQLLEDVVDLYYPVGAKKGIDVVLDPCDGSVIKFSHVKGDRGKLKQILCNLLSNAIKFTSDGHVSVRAFVRKRNLKNSIMASNRSNTSLMRHFLCMLRKSNKARQDLEASVTQYDSNCMDFVFEVDDTGKGIPKEKQKKVFENYVQVKETAIGQGGTGLGLGIVQSLVRLMHGEIGIVDKDIGERGSWFRFNVLLTVGESVTKAKQIELEGDNHISGDHNQHQDDEIPLRSSSRSGLMINIPTPNPGLNICNSCSSPRLGVISPKSPKVEGSYVVLLIQNLERRKISQKFMESLGIKVFVVEQWDQLPHTLKNIKHKSNNSRSCDQLPNDNNLSKSSSISHSSRDVGGAKYVNTSNSMYNGTHDYILSIFRKTNSLRGSSGFVLIVIDAHSGPILKLCKMVNEFKKGHESACRVVWLANSMSQRNSGWKNDLDHDDTVKYKPLHGSCLYEVVRLLPEFGGSTPSEIRKNTYFSRQEEGGSSSNNVKFKSLIRTRSSSSREGEIKEEKGDVRDSRKTSEEQPLKGKKVLVVEDSDMLRRLAFMLVSKVGANVKLCQNGKEALELVSMALAANDQIKHGGAAILPYDYILMDCEMKVMDGYEATEKIRKLEENYGVHIPIIAVTAHSPGSEEASRTEKAGMDHCLFKPLQQDNLLEAIRCLHQKSIG